ncbi:hypothetical protein HMPREF9103_01304 [Lentilactobacillus parafarraginis F0439]|uniref:Toxin-antitoxin system, toxin component, MazF family n=1 Tax=Lentilactobacillus parafarraginis F0439 TaxID=797515 RepID=G9ZNK1_9LACO|nr:type II toxin-antitoxin system PemK/MazF family toxin [Lentilactobacillus parafarraginis]EHL98749.1 hypothetical protein HMPREF9103_01304 [Lentilactobacillus parafarraginis F0439]
MTIDPFDVAWMYVGFVQGQGGKKRPILILKSQDNQLFFYAITSKFIQKSATIQKQSAPIMKWREVGGLTKPSVIDVGQIFSVDISATDTIEVTGHLTREDVINLKQTVERFEAFRS